MKLKKLMRKNGIKFPEGLNYAAQDGNQNLWFSVDEPEFNPSSNSWQGVRGYRLVFITKLASNYKTKVVTRKEYEGTKLKELMRKNIVKFPEGMNYATQDGDGGMWFWAIKPVFSHDGDSWNAPGNFIRPMRLDEVSSNYQTRIVTREEYEA